MQSTMPLIFAILAVPALAAVLRGRQPEGTEGVSDPSGLVDIKAKYDDMDDMLGTVFTMACKMKNGKDITGHAAEQLKQGKVEGAKGYAKAVKDLQASNIVSFKRSCSMIIGDSKKTCREGCAKQWNAKTAFARDECDSKCEKVYSNFERSCESKADNLGQVFEQKTKKAEAQDQCYKGHCKSMPTVWMKENAADMQEEVDAQCTKKCESDHITTKCQGEWAGKIADASAKHASACQDKSEVKTCFDGKKTEITANYTTCQSDKGGQCDTDFNTCKTKGETDSTFKDAESFCTDRKKMCKKQADEGCLKTNQKGLEEAQSECEKEAATALKTCVSGEVEKDRVTHEGECHQNSTSGCNADCQGECQVGKLNTCFANLEGEVDPVTGNPVDTGKQFCKGFWNLLHASSEVDPVTGNPVALLSQKARMTAAAQKKEKLLPLGEGAYQDPKAVMQRTVDKDTACEDGKWHDCYKVKGDYLDGYKYDNHRVRSGATSIASTTGLLVALAFAMFQ